MVGGRGTLVSTTSLDSIRNEHCLHVAKATKQLVSTNEIGKYSIPRPLISIVFWRAVAVACFTCCAVILWEVVGAALKREPLGWWICWLFPAVPLCFFIYINALVFRLDFGILGTALPRCTQGDHLFMTRSWIAPSRGALWPFVTWIVTPHEACIYMWGHGSAVVRRSDVLLIERGTFGVHYFIHHSSPHLRSPCRCSAEIVGGLAKYWEIEAT